MISDTEAQLRGRPDDPGHPGAIAVACLRRSGPLFALTLASSLALASEAGAAPARFRFNIPAKTRSEALIDLGVQARVTLGGASSCPGRSAAVVGVLTLRQALEAVTAGAPCRFEILDNATVSIRPARPARPLAGREPAGRRPATGDHGPGDRQRHRHRHQAPDTPGRGGRRAQRDQRRARPPASSPPTWARRGTRSCCAACRTAPSPAGPSRRSAPISTTCRSTTTPPTRTCG
jgi:hypothetical protein